MHLPVKDKFARIRTSEHNSTKEDKMPLEKSLFSCGASALVLAFGMPTAAAVQETESPTCESIQAKKPIVLDGSHDMPLCFDGGNPDVTITGNWEGRYVGSDLSDTITIKLESSVKSVSTADVFWKLGKGNDIIRGSGKILAEIELGEGHDEIGNSLPNAPSSDNGLKLGVVNLGSGNNTVTAVSASNIKAGTGNDTVTLKEDAGILDLGDGRNKVTAGSATDITLGKHDDTVILKRRVDDFGEVLTTGTAASVHLGNGANSVVAFSVNDIVGGSGNDTIELKGSAGSVELGDGSNILRALDLDEMYEGGEGSDTVVLKGNAKGQIKLGGGSSSNSVTVEGNIMGDVVSDAAGDSETPDALDRVSIGGGVGDVKLGSGSNFLTVNRDWSGDYTGGSDSDIVEVVGKASASGHLDLGSGKNIKEVYGSGTVHNITMKGIVNYIGKVYGYQTVEYNHKQPENKLTLAGKVVFGDSHNLVLAKEISDTGSIVGGAKHDAVALSGDMRGNVDLGGGSTESEKNIILIGGVLDGNISTTGTYWDYAIFQGGEGIVSMGDGDNILDVDGDWVGEYSGGSGDDAVTVVGNVTGKKGGTPGGDQAAAGASSSLLPSGSINVGRGNNTVKARGMVSLTAGSGNDSVYLEPRKEFSLSTLRLGTGTNKLWIIGSAGDPGSRKATVSLSGTSSMAASSDYFYVCGEATASSGCGSLSGNKHAFNVTLDAREGNTWETIKIGNEGSDHQSLLTVRGNLTLSNPELNNLKIAGDGKTGDEITIEGTYEIVVPSAKGASGTVFELDVDAKTKKSDHLIFGGSVKTSGSGFSKAAYIMANQAGAGEVTAPDTTDKIKVVTVMSGSDIESVSLLGTKVELNGNYWSLADPVSVGSSKVYYLRPISGLASLSKQSGGASGQVAASAAGAAAGWSAAAGKASSGQVGAAVSRSRGGYSGTPFWTSFTVGRERQAGGALAGYSQSVQLMNSGMELFSREIPGGHVSHQVTMQYGRITPGGSSWGSEVTGFGYGVEIRNHNESRFGFHIASSRIASEISGASGPGFDRIHGLVLSLEAGQDLRVSESLTLMSLGRLAQSRFADKTPVDEGDLADYRKLSGDIGFGFNYAQGWLGPSGQIRESLSEVYGMVAMARDLESSLDLVKADSGHLAQLRQTWTRLDLGWSVDFGDGKFAVELSAAKTTGGEIKGSRSSATLSYGLKW